MPSSADRCRAAVSSGITGLNASGSSEKPRAATVGSPTTLPVTESITTVAEMNPPWPTPPVPAAARFRSVRRVGDVGLANIYYAANTIPNIVFELVAGGALASLVVPLLAGHVAAGDRRRVDQVTSALLTWVLTLTEGPDVTFLARVVLTELNAARRVITPAAFAHLVVADLRPLLSARP